MKRNTGKGGVPYFMGYKDDLNVIEIQNIKNVVESYEWIRVWDDKSLARHLIAHHLIAVDMTKPLDINEIVNTYKETEIWKAKSSELIHS